MSVTARACRKQALFEAALRQGSVEPAPRAITLLAALRRLRVPVAVVSGSRNCAAVLAAAGLDRLVDLRVDGVDAAALGLTGRATPAGRALQSRKLA